MPATFRKDPDALLDYKIDWQTWLGTDTIVSAAVSAQSGIIVASHSVSGNVSHVIWVSAGTVSEEYTITSRIWTSAGRRNDQSFIIQIEEK